MSIVQDKIKFKVGDKVTIRRDLKKGEKYNGGCNVVSSMLGYGGKTLEIIEVRVRVGNRVRYKVKENFYSWSSDMFEHEPPTPINTFFMEANNFAKHQ